MAEATNRKVRLAVAQVEAPAKRNEADALKRRHAGAEETQSLDPAGGLG
jgi:hypothetical protein